MDLTTAIAGLSSTAAAWYNGIAGGTPVITSSQQAAANQIAIQQSQQLALGTSNPVLAGLLANPTLIVIIGLAFLGLVVWLATRK